MIALYIILGIVAAAAVVVIVAAFIVACELSASEYNDL